MGSYRAPLASSPVEQHAHSMGNTQNVNGIAFSADGRSLVSVSYDLTLRIWPLDSEASPSIVTLPTPLNSVIVADDGEIAAAGANGKV